MSDIGPSGLEAAKISCDLKDLVAEVSCDLKDLVY